MRLSAGERGIDRAIAAGQNALDMQATGEEPNMGKERSLFVALIALAAVGFSIGVVSYVRYASVWLRSPPRMPSCVLMSRRMLMREEPTSGSIPRLLLDGSTVYLRKTEDRAVTCLDRVSTEASKRLAAALAETNPSPRAQGLLSLVRDHVSKDPSADAEALATYLIAAGAMRAIPSSPEVDAAKDELDQLNACRFDLRSQCKTRPPIPMLVWAAGVPSSLVLIAGLGVGLSRAGRALVMRWRKRKAAKKAPVTAEPAENAASADEPETDEPEADEPDGDRPDKQ